MQRILALVDGSDVSMRAAQKAVDIARAFDGAVTLIHAVPYVVVPTEVPLDPAPMLEESARAGEIVLADAARDLGVPTAEQVCLKGGNADAIIDYAEKNAFDLVVVGSKGRNAVERVLIGSTTDRIVHGCTRPVLVVR